jgi:putative tricarboxylic transport membrane protein
MRNRDILSSLVWLGIGILFLVGSLYEGLFRKGIPGPGFLPFLTTLFLIALSFMVFFPALAKKGEDTEKKVENFFPEKDSLPKVVLGLVALSLFGIALEYLGYLATTFLFLMFTSKIMERKKWKTPLILAVFTAVCSYFLFVVLLQVQLPKGILGM